MTYIFEGMISIRAVIENGNRPIEKIYYSTERKATHIKEFAWLGHRAEEMGFVIAECDPSVIDKMTNGTTHGGVIALCGERKLCEPDDKNIKQNGFYLYLCGIEDPYNFGFAIRSAYAAGVDGIILTKRNWMDSAGIVARSSAGASERIDMYQTDGGDFADIFHSKGYKVVAAQIKDSVEMTEANLAKPLLLCIGGEKRGLNTAILSQCDTNVRIDYARDFPEALSAASATAVMCFEVQRQNK